MKKIKIKVRAYCNTFEIEVIKKHGMSFKDAQTHVEKNIVGTAVVISLSYVNDSGSVTTIENLNYKDPSVLKTMVQHLPKLYLKQNHNGQNSAN